MTDINHFKCPKCKMDLCMKHRFDDLHDCKPVKNSDEYEKVKKKMGLFNWKDNKNSNKNKPNRGGGANDEE